ncbi:MAG: hypothetical protein AAGF95_33985 [Chloroflexota bacterium]
MKLLKQWVPQSWSGFGALIILVLFPFIIAMLTGQPIDDGTPKCWQWMLIQVFILAVYAM